MFPHAVVFMICSDLCTLVVMLAMCTFYISLGSCVNPNNFGSVFMGTVVLSICRYRLVLYSAGSGVINEQIGWSGWSRDISVVKVILSQ